MYYFVYYIKILLTRKSRINSRFQKRTRCHSFMALKRASDLSAADWLSQTHVKNPRTFSFVEIWFLSVVEIPIKNSSLYNNRLYREFSAQLPRTPYVQGNIVFQFIFILS